MRFLDLFYESDFVDWFDDPFGMPGEYMGNTPSAFEGGGDPIYEGGHRALITTVGEYVVWEGSDVDGIRIGVKMKGTQATFVDWLNERMQSVLADFSGPSPEGWSREEWEEHAEKGKRQLAELVEAARA